MASVSSSAQPNVPGRGIVASYSPRFWMLVVLIGIAAGVGGAALIGLLHAVQHLAWSYEHGHFLEGVERSTDARRVLVLACGGVIAGVGAIGLARLGGGDVPEALWLRAGRLPLLGSFARAVESIVIVGLGASLGREAAPQQVGAAVASWLSDWARLPTWQRRLLVASGAGAGMAAVYNVPLGGALFALEVLLGTLSLPLVLPALATSLVATAVAWVALGSRPDLSRPDLRRARLADLLGAARRPDRGARLGALHPPDHERARAASVRLAQGRGADRRCSPRWGSSRSPIRRCSATAKASCSSRSSAASRSA